MEKILVVDDEPTIRSVTARVLQEEGYAILEASDGLEALMVMGREIPSLVVTDIIMPRLTGVQLVERISVSHPGLPVVLMSGYGVAELAERGIAAPCAVLAKPFSPERLIDTVRRCLAERV